MLDRNRRIKTCPQRFQDDHKSQFDVIITAEERVYDQVVEGIEIWNLSLLLWFAKPMLTIFTKRLHDMFDSLKYVKNSVTWDFWYYPGKLQ